MSARLHKKVALLLLCTLLCAAASTILGDAAQLPPRQVKRVAFPLSQGVSEYDAYGRPQGALVQYLTEIAKYTDWTYEYIPVESEDLIDRFIAGDFDLMGGTYYREDFKEYFGFPRYDMGNSHALLLGRRDDSRLQSYRRQSLNGKRIGAFAASTDKIARLQNHLELNHLECEIVLYTAAQITERSLSDRLLNGEFDLFLGNPSDSQQAFQVVDHFPAQPLYIVTQPDDLLTLSQLESALEHILEADPNFGVALYEQRLAEIQLVAAPLTPEEYAYIAKFPPLTVAVVKGFHPYYCLTESGPHNGLTVDILTHISDFTGLRFEYVYADSYAQAVQMVQQQKAMLLGWYQGDNDNAFSDDLVRTRSYADLGCLLLRHKSVQYAPGLSLGLVEGYHAPPELAPAQTVYYPSPAHLVEAVNRHEVDLAYGISSAVELEMQNHRYINVLSASNFVESTPIALGLARPVDARLLTILNKAIGALSAEQKSALADRNLVMLTYAPPSISDIALSHPIPFMLVVGAVLLVLTAVFLLLVRARMKTALVRAELARVEAQNKVKSDFFALMSHEIRTPMNAIVGLTDLTCMQAGLPGAARQNLEKIRSSSQYLLSLLSGILDMARTENGHLELTCAPFSLAALFDATKSQIQVSMDENRLHLVDVRLQKHDSFVGDAPRLQQVLINLLNNAVKFTPEGGNVTLGVEELPLDSARSHLTFWVEDTGVGLSKEDQRRIFDAFEQRDGGQDRRIGTGLGLPVSRGIVSEMGGSLEILSSPGHGAKLFFSLLLPLAEPDPTPAPRPLSAHSGKGPCILMAEDNDLNAEIATELLRHLGAQVQRAANGREALEMFASSPRDTFQLILMDLQMPEMDGLAATRAIRACGHPQAGSIGICAMTANAFREDMLAAEQAGMTDFLSKPIDVDKLQAIVQALQ